MKNILSKGTTNAKTSKNELESYILYIAPFSLNSKGINLCPSASKGCISVCLNTAGMGIFSNVQKARIDKADFYLNDRVAFLTQLVSELTRINKRATKQGKKIAVRLNGTSDIDFIGVIKNRLNIDILDAFPSLEFYDYTKVIGKAKKYIGTRYVQTFSRTENNWNECVEALNNGVNVAVVFDHTKPMPNEYMGFKVIDGDVADDLMLTNNGVILGLKAKGKAKKDVSGFVVK